jgi:hypothetical protein
MLDHHIGELIRDYGRSLLYRQRPTRGAKRNASPFDRGACAARMGMEMDDNPYPPDTHAHEDWEAGYASSAEAARATDLD